ncbi:MAG TPA: dephospho-CoA kinase [Methanoculleus sp.]|jgi:dephospho-CoA kinase|uniref:dephospho-CoA kinase n=1 Tax=Methanoculleus sp. TaxID=90427 RepID=UPI000AC44F89|nr:AAA family ATPase [Methanoculleus sp.]MBP7145708.1 flagellar hook-basal body complex protein FliE [Methanoculleus sp.]HNQ33472.1 dephospho-CoA kinase [Methanoculleus sp.]HNV37955.1 dephospho-CoA kinase [Methanoculleus sp.]HOC84767.1 dephospho-CoA kinase [Methanoculleus sp.]HOF96922.1 dephospho-CoA kinase [Methanoculleus sp.]
MKVIGIVGMPASGKGEVSRIARDLGIPVVVMGDAIREKVKEAGLPLTDANLGAISGKLRADLGMDAIARITIPVIEATAAPVVLVDGIRGDYEVTAFREHFPDFTLIAIVSSFETRYARLANRGRSDDSLTAGELRSRDERELGWGLLRALAQADCRITNEGTLEEFAAEARSLLCRVGGLS